MGYQEVPVGVGGWDKAMNGRRKVRKDRSMGSTGHLSREERKAAEVFCCRARDETWRLNLKERRSDEGL